MARSNRRAMTALASLLAGLAGAFVLLAGPAGAQTKPDQWRRPGRQRLGGLGHLRGHQRLHLFGQRPGHRRLHQLRRRRRHRRLGQLGLRHRGQRLHRLRRPCPAATATPTTARQTTPTTARAATAGTATAGRLALTGSNNGELAAAGALAPGRRPPGAGVAGRRRRPTA